ncbi:hypothetical protein DN752_14625 [Echinicola strongylocentroti]|uniref:DUF4595 domain-containing protein n=1 Tax=Echinicola strongylocentroti TaxID=1795355 RepID=A0A2Z4IKL9_9BACT|nr:hypothetical protein [Echinicola strongylocentroti]AWW31259.1 hypothetical protein DN752_14625 [Echinicola strongylocentroti]
MKNLIFIFVYILFLVSCKGDEENLPEEPRHEALSVLDGDLFTPEGKIKASRTSHLTPLTGYTYRFYDAHGNNILRVKMSRKEDTLGITILEYDELNRKVKNLFFTYESGDFVWKTSMKSIFSENGLREDVFISAPNETEEYRYSYFYNEDGGMTEWRFGREENSEKYVYFYENGRINEEQWVLEDSHIFERYFYRYRDDGLLAAKETHGTGRNIIDDATQYEYNELGQLIQVRNYDQHWGFAYSGMTEYIYY